MWMIWPAAQHGDPARNSVARVTGALTGRAGRARPRGAARPAGNQTPPAGPAAAAVRGHHVANRDGQDHQPCTGGGVHPFHMETSTAGGPCAVLRIDGDIDAYAAPQLCDRVTDLAGHGTVHIIADLRGAGFLDSAGLGALVGSRNELCTCGGSVTLVTGTGPILQINRITGLREGFAVPSCVPAAIAPHPHWPASVIGGGLRTR